MEQRKKSRLVTLKRKHHKSRKGCLQCKIRRVKCNEIGPCNHCIRRKEKCSLVPLDLWDTDGSATSLSTSSPLISSVYGISPPSSLEGYVEPFSNDESWMQDLFLMHHWSTHTMGSFSSPSSSDAFRMVWRDYLPQQAQSHKFLMHGILGVAAAHLCYLQPQEAKKWGAICDGHQNIALPLFRKALMEPTPESCGALFAMSLVWALLALSSLGRSPIGSEGEEMGGLEDVLAVFVFTRGVLATFPACWGSIYDTPLVEMTESSSEMVHYDVVILPAELQETIDTLHLVTDEYCQTNDAKVACTEAINELAKIYKDVFFLRDGNGNKGGIVMKWTMMVGQNFLTLAGEGHTAALVILAHYYMLFDLPQKRWYKTHCAARALSRIEDSIRDVDKRKALLKWPRTQLTHGFPSFNTENWATKDC